MNRDPFSGHGKSSTGRNQMRHGNDGDFFEQARKLSCKTRHGDNARLSSARLQGISVPCQKLYRVTEDMAMDARQIDLIGAEMLCISARRVVCDLECAVVGITTCRRVGSPAESR